MTTFTATFYKFQMGLWAFDDSATDTWEEPMCNGSEVAMDYWFEKTSGHPPAPDSTMTATISTDSHDCGHTFSMVKTGGDEFGTTYKDEDDNHWWLCPFLDKVFGTPPPHLFVTIDKVE